MSKFRNWLDWSFTFFIDYYIYLNIFMFNKYTIRCTFYTNDLVWSKWKEMRDRFVYSRIILSLLIIEITAILCPKFLRLQHFAQYFDNYNIFVPKQRLSTWRKKSWLSNFLFWNAPSSALDFNTQPKIESSIERNKWNIFIL